MSVLKKRLPATPNPLASAASKPAIPKLAPRKVKPNEPKKATPAPVPPKPEPKREERKSQEAPKPAIPAKQPADSGQPRPATRRETKREKLTYAMEEGNLFRHNKTGRVYTLRKKSWKPGYVYFMREDDEGNRWCTEDAMEAEALEALKAECTPLQRSD